MTSDYDDYLRRSIAAIMAPRVQATIRRLTARRAHYLRHHPSPMPPGTVTWNTRRRRHRRKARR